ncbi:hypothetical protein BDV40DRAFT_304931 [Aspergillus tamarii]|uniref:Isochorismatase-like domain-containing protein n=1 Tax=Aspergillus tamarii TaxID=41984 RepID=A0A5N6UGM6_ASPTM|nr:hypothetical protein BDV40DRAFT_304931 [Aspergillus tamarii]
MTSSQAPLATWFENYPTQCRVLHNMLGIREAKSSSCASWATPVIKGLAGSTGMHCSESQSNASRAPGARVFDKKALIDTFLVPEFSEYVSKQGFEHLVLAGLYSDICVDATA